MKKLTLTLGLILLSTGWSAAQAQVSPPQGMSEIEAYSIYLENYRNDQFKSTIEFGSWIWKGMPRTIEGYTNFSLETNLRRLINAYTGLAEQNEDPTLKEAYVDTAAMIYRKVFEEMKEDEVDLFRWHLDYGRFLVNNEEYLDDTQTRAAEHFRQAMELDREKLIGMSDGYYIKFIVQQMVAQEQEEEVIALMKELEPQVSQSTADFFNKQREKLFDTPEERIAYIKEQLSEEPENLDLLRELRSIYERQDNLEEVRRINRKLYELNPTFENIREMAELARSNANYKEAVEYLTEAMEKAPDDQARYDIAMQLSQTYLNMENLRQARSYARQAAELDPNAGEPYMRIGSIYARAVSNCTSGREMTREDRAVYWLVMDYFRRAKNVESSLANRANNQISRYTGVAPTRQDVFYEEGWGVGETIRIDGSLNECYSWINERTTIPTFE